MAPTSHPYESQFAELVGASEAVAFGFARHGIAAILRAGGLGAGDEVILSAYTCKVVALSLLEVGVRPVFVDIDPATFNLEPRAVEAAIDDATRAILFQHTYGHPAGLPEVAEIARRRGLLLIEDRAQTLPHRGVAPQLAAASVYSNNLMKPLPAGTGALAAFLDRDLATRVREARDRLPVLSGRAALQHGVQVFVYRHLFGPRLYWPLLELTRRVSPSYRPRSLEAEIEGEIRATAWRPDASQLARGSRSLLDVEILAAHGSGLCARYERALRACPGVSLPIRSEGHPLYYHPLLMQTAEEKERLVAAARRANLELITWPARTPIYPVLDDAELARYGYALGSCPTSEDFARRVVCLPTHRKVDADLAERLTRLIMDFASRDAGEERRV